ncbi:MAG TPA: hypothetical protein ENJ91_01515 [Rhodobacteraceae bacterium]|nr:hypothetical protein [Paracoccaceae bacterium]
MKKIALSTATVFALTVTGAAVSAQSELDTDGDGMLSFNELLAGFPALTEEQFTQIDTNSDGAVDGDEMKAAQEAGLLPTEG